MMDIAIWLPLAVVIIFTAIWAVVFVRRYRASEREWQKTSRRLEGELRSFNAIAAKTLGAGQVVTTSDVSKRSTSPDRTWRTSDEIARPRNERSTRYDDHVIHSPTFYDSPSYGGSDSGSSSGGSDSGGGGGE